MDRTRFLEAVEAGDVDAVRTALVGDSTLASTAGDAEPSAVLAALYRGHAQLVALLREHAKLTLAEAAALDAAERIDEILAEDRGALTSFTSDGWTPLHLAAFFGRAGATRSLIAAGAPLGEGADARNYMANRPLHAALAGAEDEETVTLLLEAGAGVADVAAGGVTPLHLAASRGNTRMVAALLERGADPSAQMDTGQTPADLARERGHPDVADRLEREGGG